MRQAIGKLPFAGSCFAGELQFAGFCVKLLGNYNLHVFALRQDIGSSNFQDIVLPHAIVGLQVIVS